MTENVKPSVFSGVDLHSAANNFKHRTYEASMERLVVRRGQEFTVILDLTEPFDPSLQQLHFTAKTGGDHASEDLGTLSRFSYPDNIRRPSSAKAWWKVTPQNGLVGPTNKVKLSITPPADAPVGEYELFGKFKGDEESLGKLVVLFNPWCSEDSVFMPDEMERQEYVLNEHGRIYKGSHNYIFDTEWDFGQFEEKMVDICLQILDRNTEHEKDAKKDVASRSDPIYVGRVITAMINGVDDDGVVVGNWSGSYPSGHRPTHWTGSYALLKQWFENDFEPVKYGQCWVFAAVMCSVMRLLGIPCRVITNFSSAHDVNMDLKIDTYYTIDGKRIPFLTRDSVWNFHVWTEGWMKRPDLKGDGKFDGWQVLDPTPQELSDGIYRCGPASVNSIFNGHTDFPYDVPFVFAEVNADCHDWLVIENERHDVHSDTKKVGKYISTKAVGSNERVVITDTYKHPEGSEKEREFYVFASTREYSRSKDSLYEEEDNEETDEGAGTGGTDGGAGTGGTDGGAGTGGTDGGAGTGGTDGGAGTEGTDGRAGTGGTDGGAGTGGTDGGAGTGGTDGGAGTGGTDGGAGTGETPPPPLPEVKIRFKEVSKPVNGKDVSLNMVLKSKNTEARPLSINITAEAMLYTGVIAGKILTDGKDQTLQPGEDLTVPILVPFSKYHKLMVESESMHISVVITDKKNPANTYLATYEVVLADPPITLTAPDSASLHKLASRQVSFTNPAKETLTKCTLTISGGGLFKDELFCQIPDLEQNHRVRVKFYYVPYKKGVKTLTADFDCATFRDIKVTATIDVTD